MTINEAFGIALKNNMIEKKISRLKLARLSGVSNTSLFMIEKGEQSPSLDVIHEISSKGFNMSPGKLVSQAYQLLIA